MLEGRRLFTHTEAGRATNFTTCPGQTCATAHFGTPGTPVTITGTNFDPLPANDRVTFTGRTANISSASPTQLVTAVPPVGSGRLAVETAFGKAFGGDFFVVPDGYTLAQVEVGQSRRVPLPSGFEVSFSPATPVHVALLIFDGIEGHTVAVHSIQTPTDNQTRCIALAAPDTTVLNVRVNDTTTLAAFCDQTVWIEARLPKTDTYTVRVAPLTNHGVVETYDVSLYNAVDINVDTAIGALPIDVTFATAQNALINFAATENRFGETALSALAKCD